MDKQQTLQDMFEAQSQECQRLHAVQRTGAIVANKIADENATLRALLQEVARFLDGEPYGVRNDFNDEDVDSYAESCQEMIARIKKEVSSEA